jgi:hypothetical protein
MLPDVPGLGVWRLDTGGWNAATSLPATIGLLKQLSTAAWIPAILRLEQRSKKAREADGKVVTHRFAVPVLDLPNLTIGRVVAAQNAAPVPRIADTPRPPATAAERVAARRAEIEAPQLMVVSDDAIDDHEGSGNGERADEYARAVIASVPAPDVIEDEEAAAFAALVGAVNDAIDTSEGLPPGATTNAGPSDAETAEPADDAPAKPKSRQRPASVATAPAAPDGVCGSIPPQNAMGFTEPCMLVGVGNHKTHRSPEGTWPA